MRTEVKSLLQEFRKRLPESVRPHIRQLTLLELTLMGWQRYRRILVLVERLPED